MLSLNILPQKLFEWFRKLQLWATGDWQFHHGIEPSHASRLVQIFFVKYPITQVTQPCYSPDLMPCDFWLFPKLKTPLKGKRFQTVSDSQQNMTGQLMATARTVWGPKVPALKGTEVSLSCVQCFLYLVSSLINVSIFHSTWLDTFWRVARMEKDMQVMIITIALLTQRNVTHNCKPSFAHSCIFCQGFNVTKKSKMCYKISIQFRSCSTHIT